MLEIRYCRLVVLPPIGKQKNYPKLILTVIYAQERGMPHGRDRIEWKLLTDLPVRSRREAVEKIQWYAQRWKIETFHKILKFLINPRLAPGNRGAIRPFCTPQSFRRLFMAAAQQFPSPSISAHPEAEPLSLTACLRYPFPTVRLVGN